MKILNIKKNGGFSLIEVIVAMGIASTVMVGLIGIMPAGVESLHDASTTTIQARIVQELISDAQMATWGDPPVSTGTPDTTTVSYLKDLAGMSNSRRYDLEGNLITNTGGNTKTASYVTLLEVPTGATSAPTIMATTYQHLKQVQIAVEFTPGGRAPDFTSDKHANYIKRYSFYLANMGTSEGINQ